MQKFVHTTNNTYTWNWFEGFSAVIKMVSNPQSAWVCATHDGYWKPVHF